MTAEQKEYTEAEQEKYYSFLDGLRETGATNMFGARPYLVEEFPELTKQDASTILSGWMKTFGERHKK